MQDYYRVGPPFGVVNMSNLDKTDCFFLFRGAKKTILCYI